MGETLSTLIIQQEYLCILTLYVKSISYFVVKFTLEYLGHQMFK